MSPARIGIPLVAVQRELWLGALRRIDRIHVRPAKHGRNGACHLVVVAACEEEHVCIASAVDNLFCENRLSPLLRLKHDTLHGVSVLNHVDAPGMEEHLHLVLSNHLVHDDLGGFRINSWLPVLLGTRQFRRVAEHLPELGSATHELLAHAARYEIPLAAPVGARRKDYEHHAVREKSAKRPITFDKRYLCPCPRGRNRRRETGRTSADDNDVSLVENRQLARGLEHLSVFQEGARDICHRMVKREDVLSEPDVFGIAAAAFGEAAFVRHVFVAERRAGRKRRAAKSELLQKFAFCNLHVSCPLFVTPQHILSALCCLFYQNHARYGSGGVYPFFIFY